MTSASYYGVSTQVTHLAIHVLKTNIKHIAGSLWHTVIAERNIRTLPALLAVIDINCVVLTYGTTPLEFAVDLGADEIASLLIKAGATVNVAWSRLHRPPLHLAIVRQYRHIAEMLIGAGADVNLRFGRAQLAPLHDAAATNDAIVTKLLLDAGGNVNVRSRRGWTALHYAARQRTHDVAQLLLAAGADVSAASVTGITPLMWSLYGYVNVDVVQLLLRAGARVHARDKHGRQCLSIVASGKCPSHVIPLLVEFAADIDAVDNDGWTALHHAAGWPRDPAVMQMLLVCGASVSAVNADGHTPLEVCQSAPCAALLLAAGATQQTSRFNATSLRDEIVRCRQSISHIRWKLIRERLFCICVALHSLELPAFVTLCIANNVSPLVQLVPMHVKWSVIVAVKHWRRQ